MTEGKLLRVSVLVPTFNRSDFLAETLEAILSQTRAPDDVLVLDDGSTDDTAHVVARFDERVRYLRQENAGKAVALNRGLAATDGDALWVCDDDDIPLPDTLARLTAALTENTVADFAWGLHDELVLANGGWNVRPAPTPRRYDEPLRVQVLRGCFVFQPGMLVRRRCYERVGGFDERLFRSQDYDMLIRLAHACRGVEVPGITFHQRAHLGLRGPAHEQTSEKTRRNQWLKYDRIIFQKVQTLYRLNEFVGETQTANLTADRIARVRRAAIFARRGMWETAAEDLRAVACDRRPLAQEERRDFATIFDWAGYGLLAIDESRPFFSALGTLPPQPARQAAHALSAPLGRRLKYSLRRANATEVAHVLGAYRRIALALARASLVR